MGKGTNDTVAPPEPPAAQAPPPGGVIELVMAPLWDGDREGEVVGECENVDVDERMDLGVTVPVSKGERERVTRVEGVALEETVELTVAVAE